MARHIPDSTGPAKLERLEWFTLAVFGCRAVTALVEQPQYRDRVLTLAARLRQAAVDAGLVPGGSNDEAVYCALRDWLVARHGKTVREADQTPKAGPLRGQAVRAGCVRHRHSQTVRASGDLIGLLTHQTPGPSRTAKRSGDATDLPKPSVQLLDWLSQRAKGRAPLAALPARFRNADLLTYCDAEGLIEFGCRNHCFVGPVGGQELHLEDGWSFRSVTGPHSKPMAEILSESTHDRRHTEIRTHISLTAKARVALANAKVTGERKPSAKRKKGTSREAQVGARQAIQAKVIKVADERVDLSTRQIEKILKEQDWHVDHVTIWRILRARKKRSLGNPPRSAKGKGETEPVGREQEESDDLSDVDSWTMPDDD